MKRQRHAKRPDANVDCPICRGSVEGYHFGILACRPCASFFRRTVASKHAYACNLQSNCEIDHKNRTMCKGCRFRRCLENGMKASAVQYNRDPIGPKKRPDADPHSNTPANTPFKSSVPFNYNVPSTSSTSSSMSSGEELNASSSTLNRMLNAYHEFCKSERSLYALLFPEKPVNSEADFTLTKHTDFIKMERGSLSFTYSMLGEWCPAFGEFLGDLKAEMFRNFFSAFSPLMKTFRTSVVYPTPGDTRVVMAFGQYLDADGLEFHYGDDPDPKQSARACWEIYELTRRIGTKMTRLRVREVEYLALAGIMFCNEVSLLCPNADVSRMYDEIVSELHDNIAQAYGADSAGSRLGALILLIHDCDLLRRQVSETVTLCRLFGPHFIELWDDY